jgi:hypothetical protein
MLTFGLFGYIGGKLGLYSSDNSSISGNNNNNDAQNNNIKYYINDQTLTIIKENIKNKTYKVIKPRNINLPVYIDTIECDDDNNVLLSGKFNQTIKNCSIKLNKFLLHEQVKVY